MPARDRRGGAPRGICLGRAALGALSAIALGGCASQRPATEIFLIHDAESALRADVASVRVVVSGSRVGGSAEIALDRTVSGTELVWPLSVGIVPRGNDATRGVTIESTATTRTGGTSRVSARTSFLPEESRALRLVHEACCTGVACEGIETCAACACAPNAVDPRTLPILGADAGP